MPPEVPLLYRIVFTFLGFSFFLMKLSIILLRSVENCAEILTEITLNLYIAFGKIAIFMNVDLTYPRAWESFLFCDIFFSFFKDLKFLSYRSFTCLVSVTPSYFMLSVAIVNGVVSLISLSAPLSSVYWRATDFFFS